MTPWFFFDAALIRQNAIESCGVSRESPCPACILWFIGRMLCSWAEGLISPQVWTWQAPRPRLLPSPCGYVYLGTGTQQLGRSLLLSGCLACPGLEAIVICYCSGAGGKGRMEVLLTASHHPLSLPLLFPSSAEMDKCLVWLLNSDMALADRDWEPKPWKGKKNEKKTNNLVYMAS